MRLTRACPSEVRQTVSAAEDFAGKEEAGELCTCAHSQRLISPSLLAFAAAMPYSSSSSSFLRSSDVDK